MDARSLTRQALALAAATLLAGCEASEPDALELPIRYETDEVEVATAFDEPLCEGDLRWLDEHTQRLELLLGVEGERLRTVYAFDGDEVFATFEETGFFGAPGCAQWVLGCYHRDDRIARGVPQALAHELVHSVSNDLDPAYVRFWYEGLAEALSEHPTIYTPADLVAESTSDDVLYPIPAHFIRWLLERQGIDPILRIFEGESFETAYGVSLSDMEQVYDLEAADVMPSPFACAEERVAEGADGSFELEASLDCSLPTTSRIRHLSSFDQIADIRVFTTEADAAYLIEAAGVAQVRIGGCQSEPGDLIEQLGGVENDAHLLAGLNPARTTEVFPGNEVFLPASTYRIMLIADDTGEPQPIRFSLTPVE